MPVNVRTYVEFSLTLSNKLQNTLSSFPSFYSVSLAQNEQQYLWRRSSRFTLGYEGCGCHCSATGDNGRFHIRDVIPRAHASLREFNVNTPTHSATEPHTCRDKIDELEEFSNLRH